MLAFGVFLVLLLTGLLAFSALAIASRLVRAGSDTALAVTLLTSAGILLPIHTLGFAHLLTNVYLGCAALLVAALGFWGSARGRTTREHAQATFDHGLDTAQHVVSLLAEVRRAGPMAWLALALFLFAIGFTTILTWVLPSDTWDGVWYHDMMVGHAIQSHSYEEIPMSASFMQQANGHPRNAEMLGLWWVIFTNRRLLELPSVIVVVPMALALYSFCVRYTPKARGTAFLMAMAFVFLPGVRLEMRTTYMDDSLGCFSLAALYFATDTKQLAKTSVLASLAIGLALGTKSHALLSMPPLALLTLAVVAVNEGRRGWRRTLAAFGVGVTLIMALGGVTYIRNVLWYGNPFHPFTLTVAGHTFQGMFPTDDAGSMYSVSHDLFMIPMQGADWPDIRRGGYGLITGFVLLPTAGLAALVLLFGLVRHAIRSVVERHFVPELGQRVVLFLALLSVVISLYASPQLWSSRYNQYAVGFGMVLAHWLSARIKAPAFATHVAGAAFVTNCILWTWSMPGWWGNPGASWGWRDFKVLMAQPRKFDVGGPYSRVDRDTAMARERELKAGDVVAFGDDSGFCSFLWNDSYSNQLIYVAPHDPAAWVAGANAVHAKWITVNDPALLGYVRAHGEEWGEVGPVHTWGGHKMFAFRRLQY